MCMQSPVDLFRECYNRFDEGQIFLSSGVHVHKITTRGKPLNVWISEVSGDIPVCQGNVNFYGITLDEDGFIVYAEVNSDTVEIGWMVVFE